MFLSELNIGFLKTLSNRKILEKNNYLYIEGETGFKIIGYLDISLIYHDAYEPMSHVVLVDDTRWWRPVDPLKILWNELKEPLITELKQYRSFCEEWIFGKEEECLIYTQDCPSLKLVEENGYLVFIHEFTVEGKKAIANHYHRLKIIEKSNELYKIKSPIRLFKSL